MKDAVIMMVDCSESMFERDEDGEMAFHQVMRAVIQTYRNKILTSGTDLLSVCFYGTKEKENPSDLTGILLFSDLDVPDGETILKLEQLLVKDFVEMYGREEKEVALGDCLWTCSTIFGNCSVKVGTKRVFLFTNNDNPNGGDVGLQAQAKQRATDLAQLGIQIELFPLNPPSKLPFLGSKFYHDIIDAGEEGDLDQLDGTSKLQELLDRARSKEYKKRSQGKVSFWITPDTEIGVRVYNLVQETKKGSTVLLDAKTSQPIRTITKRVCEHTGSLLLESQVKHGFEFGGVRVSLEKHEMRDIRSIDTPGLKLIGFKPSSSIKSYHNIKHASFIYPDDSSIRGSSTLYSALLRKMIQLDKVAIAQFIARSNASLKLVALMPFQEHIKDGIQIFPSGFYVIYLPFADDIRRDVIGPVAASQIASQSNGPSASQTNLKSDDLGDDELGIHSSLSVKPEPSSSQPNNPASGSVNHTPSSNPTPSSSSQTAPLPKASQQPQNPKRASETQISSGVSLVRKLRIQDFDCRNFDNPQLQHHYAALESIALDRKPEDVFMPEDTVQPDLEGMSKLSNLLNNFKDSVFPAYYTPPDPKQTPGKKPNAKKRAREGGYDDDADLAASGGLTSPTAKRKKLAEDVDWPALLAAGTISKCTVDQLKGYCSSKGIHGYSSLKKQGLVDLVSSHLQSNPASGSS